ncbi:MAG: sulfotransferase [Thermoleophilaceae bacterium]|nr:sulfotransferase [Thermoleophilaceae bacterium]
MSEVFPFIVGSGRSGTTLLRALLDAHPQLAVPPESYFVVTLARKAETYSKPDGFDRQAFVEDVIAHPRFTRWGLPSEAARAALEAAAPADYPAAVRALYGAYAAAQGKSRYADKTPKYVKDIPRLSSLFPEARFVHIIRDGRDVALSFKDLTWGPNGPIEAALRWRGWVELGRAAGRDLGEGRYLEVSYEDLAADPEPVLRRICDFLELEFSEQMFRYVDKAEEIIGANYYPEGHARIRMPPTKGLRDWREHMDRADLIKFELVAGDLLDELEYERGVPEATLERRRENDDAQVEGELPITAAEGVDLDSDLLATIDEMNYLRKRTRRLEYRTRKFGKQRDRYLRERDTRQRRLERAERVHARQLEKLERRRKTAVRRRKKVERTLRGLEETRWWRTRLRLKRWTRPFTSLRARNKLRS